MTVVSCPWCGGLAEVAADRVECAECSVSVEIAAQPAAPDCVAA